MPVILYACYSWAFCASKEAYGPCRISDGHVGRWAPLAHAGCSHTAETEPDWVLVPRRVGGVALGFDNETSGEKILHRT